MNLKLSRTALRELTRLYRGVLFAAMISAAFVASGAKAEYTDVINIQNNTDLSITENVNITNETGHGILVSTPDANDTGSTLTVNAGSVTVSADKAAILVQHRTEDGPNSDPSKVSITADTINLTGQNGGGKNSRLSDGYGVVSAMSQGIVELNGNTTITANPSLNNDAILARGNAVVAINKDTTDKTTVISGNIDFNYSASTSGSTVNANVDVTLNGEGSSWTGNTVMSYDTTRKDEKMQQNETTIRLQNGATWNASEISDVETDTDGGYYYTALNNLNVNNGIVNIADTTRGIEVENLTASGLTVTGGVMNVTNTADTTDNTVDTYAGVKLANNASVKGDVNLSSNTGDKFNTEGAASINYIANMLSVNEAINGSKIEVASDGTTVSINQNIYDSATKISLGSDGNTGKITVAVAGGSNLDGASQDDAKNVVYRMKDNEDFTGGTIQSNDFTLYGNSNAVDLDGDLGVGGTSSLTLENVALNGTGKLVNEGTTTIKDSEVNIDIWNKPGATLNSDPTTYTGTITNDSTFNLEGDTFAAGATLVNNSVTNMTDATFEKDSTINGTGTLNSVDGTNTIGATVTGQNINIQNGSTLKLTEGGNIDGATLTNDTNGGTLDLRNDRVDALFSTALSSNLTVKMDADLSSGSADSLGSVSGGKTVTIDALELLSLGGASESINIASAGTDVVLSTDAENTLKTYYGTVAYNSATGNIDLGTKNASASADLVGTWGTGEVIKAYNAGDAANTSVGANLTALDTAVAGKVDKTNVYTGVIDDTPVANSDEKVVSVQSFQDSIQNLMDNVSIEWLQQQQFADGIAIGTGGTAVQLDQDTSGNLTINKDVLINGNKALTTASIAEGATNGTIAVNGTDVAVHGLGSAAYTASTDYATAAQGTKADSAIQSVKVNGTALTPDASKAVDILIAEGATNGTIKVNGTDVAVHGLGDAAYKTVLSTTIATNPTSNDLVSAAQVVGYAQAQLKNDAGTPADISSTVLTTVRATASASDTNLVTEKAIATALDGKINTSDIVTSWSTTTSDSKVASEKLVKDSLDLKVDKSDIATDKTGVTMTLAEVNAYVAGNSAKLANIGTTAALVTGLFNDKQAWIGEELGYDTTTTDAHTILAAAGFTDQTSDSKLGLVDAALQLQAEKAGLADDNTFTGTNTFTGKIVVNDGTANADQFVAQNDGSIHVQKYNTSTSAYEDTFSVDANGKVTAKGGADVTGGLKLINGTDASKNATLSVDSTGVITTGGADINVGAGTVTATKVAAGANGTALTDAQLLLKNSAGNTATLTATAGGLNVAEGLIAEGTSKFTQIGTSGKYALVAEQNGTTGHVTVNGDLEAKGGIAADSYLDVASSKFYVDNTGAVTKAAGITSQGAIEVKKTDGTTTAFKADQNGYITSAALNTAKDGSGNVTVTLGEVVGSGLTSTVAVQGDETVTGTLTADGESKFGNDSGTYSLDVTTSGVTANKVVTAKQGVIFGASDTTAMTSADHGAADVKADASGQGAVVASVQTVAETREAINTEVGGVLGGIYKVSTSAGAAVSYDASALDTAAGAATKAMFKTGGTSAGGDLTASLGYLAKNISAITGGTISATDGSVNNNYAAATSISYNTLAATGAETTSLAQAIGQVDKNIGAAITGVTRSVSGGTTAATQTVNANLSALDATIGGDMTSVTTRSVSGGTTAATQTVNANLSALDATIGGDMTVANASATATVADRTTTAFQTKKANTVNQNLSALDAAIGTDTHLNDTTVNTTTGNRNGVSTSKSINQNIAALTNVMGDIALFQNSTTGNLANKANPTTGVPGDNALTVSQAVQNIDATLGTIHDLNGKRGAAAKGNLAVVSGAGTSSVEDHLVAIDDAIGDRSQFGQSNYMAANAPVADSLMSLDHSLKRVEKEMRGGFASMAAMSALVPNARAAGDTQISVGVGAFRDHQGMALGAFHYFNDNILANFGASYGGDKSAVFRAGVTFGW